MATSNGNDDFEQVLAACFKRAGWRVRMHPVAGNLQADLIASAGNRTYIAEVKSSSEPRSDRLIPLLSQAILQAQAYARKSPKPATPLAVVASRCVPESIAEHLKRFAGEYAPDVAVGVIDAEGFASFAGGGLEALNAESTQRGPSQTIPAQRLPDLFSDLNQWMLKILVGQRLPEPLVGVPHVRIRNASHLAEIAKVSTMSASRLTNQLESRGFLDESRRHLELVRIDELLELWASSNRESANEIPARWILQRGKDQLGLALRQYASRRLHNQPRCCLGLFSAADALGLGFVLGAPAHIYLERMTLDSLHGLGLAVDHKNGPADLMIRIPENREAIFRPTVERDGAQVSDVLQVWLDVSTHPARGREQARAIRERVLRPLFGERR